MTVAATVAHRRRRRWLVPSLVAALLAVAGFSLAMGAVSIAPSEVVAVLGARLGLGGEPSVRADAVVWGLRLPRVVLGVVVGGVLAASGAVLQGMLRNDLADPQLIGIGPGAAVGAALGAAAGVPWAVVGGVLAGTATAVVMRALAAVEAVDRTRIILAGVALGLALSAWVGFVVFAADRATVPPLEFWLLGSLAAATWRTVWLVAIPGSVAVAAMISARRPLDLLALGDAEAHHLGVAVDRVRTLLLVAVGVAVGAAVGGAGVIAFVALLVPFVVRVVIGPSHGRLLPAVLVAGALFVVACDLAARLAVEPVELPIGLVTAAIGGPLFVWLVIRRRDV